MTVGDEEPADLTAGVEHGLVERVPVGAHPLGQRVHRDAVQHERDEDLALPVGQLPVDGPPDRVEQVGGLRGVLRGEPESVGQHLPLLGLDRLVPVRPGVPRDLPRHL